MSSVPIGQGHVITTDVYYLDQVRRGAAANKAGKTASQGLVPQYGVDVSDAVTVTDSVTLVETGAIDAFEVIDDSGDQKAFLLLDRDVVDGSGNQNNGTVSGTDQYTAGPLISTEKGQIGFDFDGSTQVTVATEGDFDRTHTEAVSIMFWAKWTSATTMALVTKMTAIANTGISITAESSGKLRIRFINTATSNEIDVITTTATYNDGRWHNFIITKTTSASASGVTLYHFGTSVTLTTTTDNLSATLANAIQVTLGGYNDGSADFTGQMYNFQWWNVLLTAAQIADLADGRQISVDATVDPAAFSEHCVVEA